MNVLIFVNLEIQFGLLVLFGVGEDSSDSLFRIHLVALFDRELGEVGIDRPVVTVLHDHGVCTADHETTGHLTFIDCAGFGAGCRLQVNTFVVYRHL